MILSVAQLLAIVISRVMGPTVSLVLFLSVALLEGQLPSWGLFYWLAVLLFFAGGIPLLYLFIQRRRGLVGDFDITEREERMPIFAVAIGSWFFALVLTYLYDLSLLIQAMFTAGIIIGLVFVGVTARWKISVHSGFWTALCLLLWVRFGPHYLWLLLGLIPISWARYRLNKHTLAQLLAGAVVAGSLLLLVFGWFDLLPVNLFSSG